PRSSTIGPSRSNPRTESYQATVWPMSKVWSIGTSFRNLGMRPPRAPIAAGIFPRRRQGSPRGERMATGALAVRPLRDHAAQRGEALVGGGRGERVLPLAGARGDLRPVLGLERAGGRGAEHERQR